MNFMKFCVTFILTFPFTNYLIVLSLQMLAAKFHGNFLINLLGVWGVSCEFCSYYFRGV